MTHASRDTIEAFGGGAAVIDAMPAAAMAEPAGAVTASVAPIARLDDARSARTSSYGADLVTLTKPRIVTMILVTTVASAWIAGGVGGDAAFGLGRWCLLLAATAMVAGAAGAANQIWERVIDREMTRTATRPLPDGRMATAGAVAWTAAWLIVGTAGLAWGFGVMPAVVGVATWAVYVLIYTPMKIRSAWNTTVGAVAGAMPVFIGYTAAGGTMTDLAGWMLFGVLACWQYPHFMAIAWLYRRQYGDAGFRMTTVVDPTGRDAAWQSIAGAAALLGCGVAMCLAPRGEAVWTVPALMLAVGVVLAGLPLVRSALRFAGERDDASARRMMRTSLWVLPAVLLVMTLRVCW